MFDVIKEWFRPKTYEEIEVAKYKHIVDNHFGELIDWNLQTSMYSMLVSLIHNIDDVHLQTMAELHNENLLENIEVQLKDAIQDVLKMKGLIND